MLPATYLLQLGVLGEGDRNLPRIDSFDRVHVHGLHLGPKCRPRASRIGCVERRLVVETCRPFPESTYQRSWKVWHPYLSRASCRVMRLRARRPTGI